MNTPDSPFLPHGGYRKLRSYKVAEAVYDATVVFCKSQPTFLGLLRLSRLQGHARGKSVRKAQPD